MASLREEYREVTDALERAYEADKAAYTALPRRSNRTRTPGEPRLQPFISADFYAIAINHVRRSAPPYCRTTADLPARP